MGVGEYELRFEIISIPGGGEAVQAEILLRVWYQDVRHKPPRLRGNFRGNFLDGAGGGGGGGRQLEAGAQQRRVRGGALLGHVLGAAQPAGEGEEIEISSGNTELPPTLPSAGEMAIAKCQVSMHYAGKSRTGWIMQKLTFLLYIRSQFWLN